MTTGFSRASVRISLPVPKLSGNMTVKSAQRRPRSLFLAIPRHGMLCGIPTTLESTAIASMLQSRHYFSLRFEAVSNRRRSTEACVMRKYRPGGKDPKMNEPQR